MKPRKTFSSLIGINHFCREVSTIFVVRSTTIFIVVVRDSTGFVFGQNFYRFRRAIFYPFFDARQSGFGIFVRFLTAIRLLGDGGACGSRFHASNGSDRAATWYLVKTSGTWYAAEDLVSNMKRVWRRYKIGGRGRVGRATRIQQQ